MFRNGLEPWHILVLVVVLVLLFGAKKLPDAARSLGQSLRIFKAESRAMKEDEQKAAGGAPPAQGSAPANAPVSPPPAQLPAGQPVGPVVAERIDTPQGEPR